MDFANDSTDVSIIVVDDARFTCEMIRRVLVGAGFRDIRIANSAQQVQEMMQQRKANILIADWLMPEVDGLALTSSVRQFDEEAGHYTYIILLTAKEGSDSLSHAFSHGVDDFINKSPDNKELLARIRAAGRISELQNALLRANTRLRELNRQLEERNSFDAVTGLGNRAYLERQLDNMLRHSEARGGVACCGLIRLNDLDLLKRRHGEQVIKEVVEVCATRLQQSVRPLDVIGKIDHGLFGLLMYQERAERVHLSAFRRIHQALNLRAYKTSAGFINVGAAIAVACVPPVLDTRLAPAEIIAHLYAEIDTAQQQGLVHLVDLRQVSERA